MSPPRPKTPRPDSDPASAEAPGIDRWKQIDELLDAALERPDSERSAYLEAACAGDERLRIEVESLLSADARSSSMVESPVAEIAARVLGEKGVLAAGQRIGHYKIVALIGKGGMGAVYLAEDLKLGRKVALKLLPDYFTRDRQRVRRFEQEARAISALNHPNILVIHEIGSEGDTHFIITEYIEGETLRGRLARCRLPLRESLDLAIQVASALDAAHKAGIVHRDIKPENIMLRPDGVAKVLDFGLAKLTEARALSTDTEAATVANLDTEPGTIIGTANYMSPEQARGQAMDSRSDLFSVGVVLYELIAGRSPFEADTKTDVLASILTAEPPPLSSYQAGTPAELQRIAVKALRKDREERYQTAKDLLIDLKALRDDLEFESRLERSASPDIRTETATTRSPGAITSPVAGAQTVTVANATKRRRAMLGLVVALVIAGVVAAAYFSRGDRADVTGIESLVILPFANGSEDANADYLSDGITETLINSFSQLPRLKVTARTTAFRYKAADVDPQRAGRELSVQAALTGRVTQQGDRLIIQAELIKVSDGTQVWGERYSRKMSDVFAMQDEIARAITDKLRLKLGGEEQGLLTKRYTTNAEAYELYLKGRHWWNGRSPEGLRKAIDYFNKAIEKDSDYALAYSGLADCYTVSSQFSLLSPMEAYPKAKAAAMKALAIDDRLAEAHVSLANTLMNYDWDWLGAEREFKRAIELNPSYMTAHQWYGEFLARTMQRYDEGIAEVKRAIELDPFSSIAISGLATIYYESRQYDEAIAQSKRILEIDPTFPLAYMHLATSYSRKGMHEEALGAARYALKLDPDSSRHLMILGVVNARAGNQPEARRILNQLQRLSKRQYVKASHVAVLLAALGEKDEALAWLEKAYETRDVQSLSTPGWDSLRSDPRFKDLARRVGLPE